MNMDEILVIGKDDEDGMHYFYYCILTQLKDEFDENRSNNSATILYKVISKILNGQEKVTVVIDNNYIDKIYRDCYYNHFSGKHFEYSRYCKRVFLFLGDCCEYIAAYNEEKLQDNFIGCFVVKPLKVGAIGRTLLNPKYIFGDYDSKNIYVRTTNYCVHLRGMKLFVNAFPYSMQDSETLTCAESTLLNIFDYYSNQYSDYKFMLPSEIFNVAKLNWYERILPATGMSYMLMSRIMVEFGFYPRLYLKDAIKNDEELIRILSYYVESAIPVAIGICREDHYNHSIACIGHGKNRIENMLKKLYRVSTNDFVEDDIENVVEDVLYIADSANTIDEYIVMDDNLEPYSIYKTTIKKNDAISNEEVKLNNSQLICLAVPLYKRMYLEAKDARAICVEILKEKQLSFVAQYQKLFFKSIGTEENPIVIRIFLASSRNFKNDRIMAFKEDDICKKIYSVTPFPQFVWVCELYDLKHYKNQKPLGEIVLDATSTANTKPFDSVIMVNYPGKYLTRHYNGSSNEIIEDIMCELDCLSNLETVGGYKLLKFEAKLDFFKMYKSNLHKVSDL